MIKSGIPIFITVDTSIPEIKKLNAMMLPYAFYYLNKLQTIHRCIVISSDDDILNYAKLLGFNHTYKEKCIHCKDCHIEYMGIYHHMQDFPDAYDWFIKFSLDQPFKSENLILDAIMKIRWDLDFLVSSSTILDRERMYINEDGKFLQLLDNKNRCMGECIPTKIVDCSLFCIKTSFFKKCVESNEFYKTLWGGKYELLHNKAMFIQILAHHHIERFETVHNIYQEVQKLPKFEEVLK